MADPERLGLPPEYAALQVLARRDAVTVARARRGADDVVVRVEHGGASHEVLAELAVLAAVDHPGLARLLDWGMTSSGSAFVARPWIAGQELGEWAAGQSQRAIGALVVELCAALHALHGAGFVHGDLKPDNVLVTSAGRPVLVDYGLSTRAAHAGAAAAGVQGTLFAIAPEVLLGEVPRPASDLFALGALLHRLLLGTRSSARAFYARFPRQDFFAATDTEPGDLPTWARDVVARLVAREPADRPASAAAVARQLAGRLDLGAPATSLAAALSWPELEGRRELADTAASALERGEVLRIDAPTDECAALARALRRELAARGQLAGACDLDAGAAEQRSASALDAWADSRAAGGALVAWCSDLARGGDALSTLLEAAARHAVGCVVVAPRARAGARSVAAAAPSAPVILAFLERNLERTSAGQLERLAKLLDRAARGSVVRLGRALARAAELGVLVSGDERARLVPGALPGDLDPDRVADRVADRVGGGDGTAVTELSGAALDLAALLAAAGRPLSIGEASELGARGRIEATRFAAAAVELAGRGAAERLDVGARSLLRLTARGRAALAVVPEARWRAWHGLLAASGGAAGADAAARAARAFVHAGAGGGWPARLRGGGGAAAADAAPRAALHAWRAAPEERARAAALADVMAAERHAGRPAEATALARETADCAELGGVEIPAEILAEAALAWVMLGAPERASEIGAELERRGARAAALRVAGETAAAQHDATRARAALAEAAALDARHAPALYSFEVGEAHDAGEHARVLELARAADAPRAETPEGRHARARAAGLAALSLFRLGRVDEARAEIERLAREAQDAGEVLREAALHHDLGVLERRTGSLAEALRRFERAAALYDEAGSLAGLAQALTALGGARRESGELLAAEPPLARALALRERLADATGAALVRGTLGLLLAERGHVAPALAELERCRAALAGNLLALHGPLVSARARELELRIGRTPSAEAPAPAGDPRAALSAARALALAGQGGAALAALEVVEAEALRRSLEPLAGEARAARAVLLAQTGGEQSSAELPVLARQDLELLGIVLAPAPDSARAAALARELARAGRDDRAARLELALAVRATWAGDRRGAESHAEQARAHLARCQRGLTADEAGALRGMLFGLPDPRPADLEDLALPGAPEDGLEMEVLKLLDINHRLVRQEDLATLLGVIVENALAVSGAERGFLMLEDQGELRLDTARGSRRGGIADPEIEVSRSVVNEALAAMKPLRLSNAADDPLLRQAPSVVALELRSILAVPFRADEHVRGVLVVDHRLRAGAFSERSERLLTLLADQAALAIAQVRRVAEIRALNRELGRRVESQASDLRTARAALAQAGIPAPAGGMVGNSPAMQQVRRLIERAAKSGVAVLVTGASGTGKELAARAVHELSPRASGPLVAENVAALPPALIEAELFGHARGAFTGADRDREGLFERAHGGTLFLDEIGDLPLELQAKLLRVLETGEVRRVGEAASRKVDFRLVAATNRDLEREVRESRFRADLFYRLNALRVELPTLAERAQDIPELVDHFLRLEAASGGRPRSVSRAVLSALVRRPWPGNVRELANEVARLCALADGAIDDPSLVSAPALLERGAPSAGPRTLEQIEREAIVAALQRARGDKRAAADELGISRAKVYQRLKEWRDAGALPAELAEAE